MASSPPFDPPMRTVLPRAASFSILYTPDMPEIKGEPRKAIAVAWGDIRINTALREFIEHSMDSVDSQILTMLSQGTWTRELKMDVHVAMADAPAAMLENSPERRVRGVWISDDEQIWLVRLPGNQQKFIHRTAIIAFLCRAKLETMQYCHLPCRDLEQLRTHYIDRHAQCPGCSKTTERTREHVDTKCKSCCNRCHGIFNGPDNRREHKKRVHHVKYRFG